MAKNKNVGQQPQNIDVPGPLPKPASLTAEEESMLIDAKCKEKERNYTEAIKLYTKLRKEEDAMRCSELKAQKKADDERHEYNKGPIYALTITTFICICVFLYALIQLNKKEHYLTPPSVQWLNKGKVELGNYPNWFYYDKTNNRISTKATITEKMKLELQMNYPSNDSTNFQQFREAVDKLAFRSSDMGATYLWLLFLVSGLAAVVGVLIREILDLIYHYCYQNDLDFKMWWPWYLLRPIVGFVVGIIVILFSGTDLLFSSGDSSGDYYLIAISIIAGISIEDVMFKLRKISQVVFGDSSQSNASGKSVAPGSADKTAKSDNPDNHAEQDKDQQK